MQKLLQDKHIGKNIQRIRNERKMSQEDVIVKLELSGREMIQSTYSRIELGIGNIFVSDLDLLKQIFNVDYNEFFKGL